MRLLHGRWTDSSGRLLARLLARPPWVYGRCGRDVVGDCRPRDKEWKGAGGRRPPANFDEIRRDESFLSIGNTVRY